MLASFAARGMDILKCIYKCLILEYGWWLLGVDKGKYCCAACHLLPGLMPIDFFSDIEDNREKLKRKANVHCDWNIGI